MCLTRTIYKILFNYKKKPFAAIIHICAYMYINSYHLIASIFSFLNFFFLTDFSFMLLLFAEYHLLLILLVSLLFSWLVFFKLNYYTVLNKKTATDKLRKKTLLRYVDHKALLQFTLNILYTHLILYYILRGSFNKFWWQHLYINNYIHNMLFYILLLSVMTVSIMYYFYTYKRLNYNFFFAVLNIILYTPLLFLSNSFFTFFFYWSYALFYFFIN